jgi:hypothetical protein
MSALTGAGILLAVRRGLTAPPFRCLIAGMDIYRQAQFPKFAIVICEAQKNDAGHADLKRWKEFQLNIPQELQRNSNIERIPPFLSS